MIDPTTLVAGQGLGIFGLWENYHVFVTLLILFVGGIGLMSKTFAVPAYGGYLVFAVVAIETGTSFFMEILYATLTLIMVGMAFKVWRSEVSGVGQ